MSVDLRCPQCHDNLGKDREEERWAGCGTCGEVFFNSEGHYPYEEGEKYWTIDKGEAVFSFWDDQSEEMHDDEDNRSKEYFDTEEDALKSME
jgi:hypothetical protein